METYVCPDSNNNKYKGVRKRKWGKYVSEIRLPNSRERIWLGSFDSPEKAARAFDAALFCLRGPSASFNFPQHPPNIPGGRSLSPSEIQAVAARFANEEPLPMPLPQELPQRDEINDVSEEEVENGSGETTMDWSFLETLDSDVVGSPSEFGYSYGSDLMYYHTDQPASPSSYGLYEDGGIFVDDYSHHYSLWNFK